MTQPVFEILWDDIVVGTTLFELGDPPMGVAFGHFQANASYRAEHLIEQDRLSARFASQVIPSVAGVEILDGFEEFGERQVTIFGVGHPLYNELFPHNTAAYEALYPPDPRTGLMHFIAQAFRAARSRCKGRLWLIGRKSSAEESTLPAFVVHINSDEITDWSSFHAVFKREIGFPSFYGKNMNAWIDCMGDIDRPGEGMTSLAVSEGQLVVLQVKRTASFAARCPEQYQALIDACAFVNTRRQADGEPATLALLFEN